LLNRQLTTELTVGSCSSIALWMMKEWKKLKGEGTYGSMRKNFLCGFPLPPFVYFSSGPPGQADDATAVKPS